MMLTCTRVTTSTRNVNVEYGSAPGEKPIVHVEASWDKESDPTEFWSGHVVGEDRWVPVGNTFGGEYFHLSLTSPRMKLEVGSQDKLNEPAA